PRVSIPAAGPVIGHVAQSAMQLQAHGDRALDFAVREQLDHGDLARDRLSRGPSIEGRVIELPGRLEARGELRHLVPNRLESIQRASERAALAEERGGFLERAPGPGDSADSSIQAFAIQRLLDVAVASPRLAEDVR